MDEQNKKTDALTDKAFLRLMVTSFLAIFVCIVCLCSTTWCWFSDSAPSSDNRIAMASECLLEVTVAEDGTALADIENGVELQAGVAYIVTLSLPADTASGYCVISAGTQTYYTDYIARHSDPVPKTVSFTLSVGTTQTVTFTPRWGIYAQESDVRESALLIP